MLINPLSAVLFRQPRLSSALGPFLFWGRVPLLKLEKGTLILTSKTGGPINK